MEVQTGIDHEPVLLSVLRLASSSKGHKGQHFIESQHVFSCISTLQSVCDTFTPCQGIVLKNGPGSEGQAENWKIIPEEDMQKTLRSIGLSDGDSVLVLDRHHQR